MNQEWRGRKPRKQRKTILLVTNGASTERNYLSHIARDTPRGKASVTTQVYEGLSPDRIIKKLQDGDLTAYDEVWIVVDHDGTDKTDFLKQCTKCSSKKPTVNGVVSVPCFEVWLNAHYEWVRNYQNQQEAQRHYRELTRLSGKDSKTIPNSFPWEEVKQACTRSRLKNVPLPERNIQGPCPSTTMPHLIASLGLIDEQDLH